MEAAVIGFDVGACMDLHCPTGAAHTALEWRSVKAPEGIWPRALLGADFE